MNTQTLDQKISLADYYKGLDYAVRMLFKKEVLKQTEWSEGTFALRFRHNNFRPSERMMIEAIIEAKSFLNV